MVSVSSQGPTPRVAIVRRPHRLTRLALAATLAVSLPLAPALAPAGNTPGGWCPPAARDCSLVVTRTFLADGRTWMARATLALHRLAGDRVRASSTLSVSTQRPAGWVGARVLYLLWIAPVGSTPPDCHFIPEAGATMLGEVDGVLGSDGRISETLRWTDRVGAAAFLSRATAESLIAGLRDGSERPILGGTVRRMRGNPRGIRDCHEFGPPA